MRINDMGLYKAWKRMPEMRHEFRWKRTVVVDTAAQRRRVLKDLPIVEMGVYKALVLIGSKFDYTDEEKLKVDAEKLNRILKIQELREKGVSVKAIAEEVGYTVMTVRKKIKELAES